MSVTTNSPASTVQTPLQTATGNLQAQYLMSVTLSPSAVSANTSAEETFSVNGLLVGDFVQVNKPTAQAGLAIVGQRVSANNTLAITFGNFTASPITPTASQAYTILVSRPMAYTLSDGLPTSLPTS
jgi:hypothetical protein